MTCNCSIFYDLFIYIIVYNLTTLQVRFAGLIYTVKNKLNKLNEHKRVNTS
jgi:hypothetical protein